MFVITAKWDAADLQQCPKVRANSGIVKLQVGRQIPEVDLFPAYAYRENSPEWHTGGNCVSGRRPQLATIV
jgi:hypothetical protein